MRMACKIATLVLAILVTWGIVWLAPGTYPHDLASLVNKRAMLANAPGKRMIFMGGSSALTLNSPAIQKEFGYTVVNMALWGGLGTRQYIEEIKPLLRSGDIVIVTQEYATALDPSYIQYINTNEEAKKFFFLLSPWRHTREMINNGDGITPLKYVLELSQLKVRSFIRNLLTVNIANIRSNGFPNYHQEFNEHGDRRSIFADFRPLADSGKKYGYPSEKNHRYLNDFTYFAKDKNVQVFFYFSHFPVEEFIINEPYIRAYETMMRKMLQCTVLNTTDTYKFPREYFGDTIYHLNPRGEEVRTKIMIELLHEQLKK